MTDQQALHYMHINDTYSLRSQWSYDLWRYWEGEIDRAIERIAFMGVSDVQCLYERNFLALCLCAILEASAYIFFSYLTEHLVKIERKRRSVLSLLWTVLESHRRHTCTSGMKTQTVQWKELKVNHTTVDRIEESFSSVFSLQNWGCGKNRSFQSYHTHPFSLRWTSDWDAVADISYYSSWMFCPPYHSCFHLHTKDNLVFRYDLPYQIHLLSNNIYRAISEITPT